MATDFAAQKKMKFERNRVVISTIYDLVCLE